MRENILTQIFRWSIVISIIFTSIQLMIRIYIIAVLTAITRGNDAYRNKLSFIAQMNKIETVVYYIVFLSFLVLLSVWFYLKYKKAHQQSPIRLSYKPIWALFSFIIPIFNLYAPYKIMNDLWTRFNKDLSIETFGKNSIKQWWFLSIGLFVFSRYLGIRNNQAVDLHDVLWLQYFYLFLCTVSIHYFLLLRRLVKLLGD